jgi:hypothetical protein
LGDKECDFNIKGVVECYRETCYKKNGKNICKKLICNNTKNIRDEKCYDHNKNKLKKINNENKVGVIRLSTKHQQKT